MTDWRGVAVVVVGSMNVDQVVYCERFPEDGETLVARRYAQGFGGKGANQAVMAARLGARVAMVGCLGDDDLGEATMANLAAHGVDATGVATSGGDLERRGPDLGRRRRDQPHPHRARRQRRGDGGPRRRAPSVGDLPMSSSPSWRRRRPRRRRPSGGPDGSVRSTVLNPAPAAAVEPSVLARADWLVANESEFRILRRRRRRAGDGARGRPDVGLRCGRHPRPRRRARRHRGPARGRRRRPRRSTPSTPPGPVMRSSARSPWPWRAGTTPVSRRPARLCGGALAVQRPGTQTSFPTPEELDAVSPR